MQIRVITLKGTSKLIDTLQTLFPRADVGTQRGINVSGVSSDLLFQNDMITHSVDHTLRNGRKWHHEIPSKGAIGVAQANRLALQEDLTQPLLLLEEDCIIKYPERFKKEVLYLLTHMEKFDMAVFGCLYQGKAPLGDAEWLPPGFKILKDKFWLLHSVLYTPSGRVAVSALLHRPLEMQIDSLYGAEASKNRLRVLGQLKGASTRQSLHVSTIQNSPIGYVPIVFFALALCVLIARSTRRSTRRSYSLH